MRTTDLFEMPIQNLNLVGNFDKAHSFRHAQDRKLLSNPKAQQKIIHKWQNTVVDFNMYFVNAPGMAKHAEHGEVSMDWLQANMPKVAPQLEINPEAINVIFTNNNGAERFPMTAWVIAHRLGHAIQASGRFNNGARHIQQSFDTARNTLLRNCSEILSSFGKTIPKTDAGFSKLGWYGDADERRKKENLLRSFYHAIGTMKSARDRQLRTEYEFVYELLAQYIVMGKITFNLLPKSFKHGKPAWGRFPMEYFSRH